ncbi:uncharacterized protein LOC127105352 [Lathyrus oleraceus]|uniref:uncharacterized protein LOC127105352 n=1 Tax=Pisum sativum TaxID=3888 RepID=UPI0021CF668B|nr:uncharacterized protein LOC127105352 [Pisum sativum]
MTVTCEPIFNLLRKDQAIEWNSDCQQAFEKIKGYLQEPPILIPPIPGKPLFMYLTVLEGSMGCVLGQHDETGKKEHAIYYLSKKFTDCESRYSLLEKTCCALAWAAIHLRLSRWHMLLSEYDIQYITHKSIKGIVLSDYLANHPVEDCEPLKFDFPDEDIMLVKDCETPSPDEGPEPGSCWKIMFDGSFNCMGHGVGAMLMNPNGGYTPFTARLCFECTKNIVEYEACILGIKILEVYRESSLVIYQVKGEWETRDEKLIPYHAHIMELIKYFDEITFHHVPREESQIANALDMLASMFQVRFLNEAPLIIIERKIAPAYCILVEEEIDEKPRFYDIKNYLQNQEYPVNETTLNKKTLRRLASKFFLSNEVNVSDKWTWSLDNDKGYSAKEIYKFLSIKS